MLGSLLLSSLGDVACQVRHLDCVGWRRGSVDLPSFSDRLF